jgi:hypothetical protein
VGVLARQGGTGVLPDVVGHHASAREHAHDFADSSRLGTLLQDAGFEIATFERHADGLWVGSSPADVLFAQLPDTAEPRRGFEALAADRELIGIQLLAPARLAANTALTTLDGRS